MPTTQTPSWQAVRNGLSSDPGATLNPGGVNQLLGSHASAEAYLGNPVVSPGGTGATAWALQFSTLDIDQPFTMSGTNIGRVRIPLLSVGEGADLLVSLCADNAGSPGTLISRTRIPASWISRLSAVSGIEGPSSSIPTISSTGSDLATAASGGLLIGAPVAVPWPTPAASGAANTIAPAVAVGGNYLILAGGVNTLTAAPQSAVYTIAWNGSTGLNAAIPQPSLPVTQVYGGLAVTTDTVAYFGGGNTGAPYSTDVYTASWNPATGTIGAWSSQASFPTNAHQPGGVATYGNTIYTVGDGVAGPNSTNVIYATVSNGQITSWFSGNPLPQALSQVNLAAINGFLIVVGGVNGLVGGVSTVYYAAIDAATGAPGPWLPGPSVPQISYNGGGAHQIAVTDSGVLVSTKGGTDFVASLPVSVDGLGQWTVQYAPDTSLSDAWAAFSAGDGIWQMFTALPTGGPDNDLYYTMDLNLTPTISVPIPVSGLTNGVTYHLLMQQHGGTLTDYLRTSYDMDVFSGNPTALTSPRGTNTWTPQSAGTAVPIQIFDQTSNSAVLHTWEDSGARISTIVSATTPDQTVLGLAESVTQPGLPLNAVWHFQETLGQWNATGGAVVRSSAHAFQQLSWSAQVTPTGAAAQCYILSGDYAPVSQGHTYTATAVIYSQTGYSNCSVNINWYTSANAYISTTAGPTTSIPSNASATLTVSSSGSMPSNAAYAQVAVQEAGTPPASAVFWVFIGALTDNLGGSYDNVVQMTYDGAWPGYIGAPTAIVQLA